jgi:hypothetical protein
MNASNSQFSGNVNARGREMQAFGEQLILAGASKEKLGTGEARRDSIELMETGDFPNWN